MAKEFFYALDSHNLYKVNTSSDEVEWTASLEADVFSNIAATPDGKSVFVNNHAQNKVFQVDASSGDLEAAIDVNKPLSLVASADNNSLWVSGESNEAPGLQTQLSLSLVDISAGKATPTPALQRISPFSDLYANLDITNDGKLLYATACAAVHVVDTQAKKKTGDLSGIPNLGPALELTVSKDAKKLYVVCSSSNDCSIVNLSGKIIAGKIGGFGGTPGRPVLSSDQKQLYITSPAGSKSGTVHKFDLATRKQSGAFETKIRLGSFLRPLLITSDDKYLYLASADAGLVKIDASSMEMVSKVDNAGSDTFVVANAPL